ncbi:MAG: radical SAM protein [Elusimicrobiota bacterium]
MNSGTTGLKPIMVPGKCDLACAWCNIRGTLPPDARWNFDQVTQDLRRVAAQGVRSVAFGSTSSEPTTHPDFPRVVASAKAIGFEAIRLFTSGITIADPVYLRQLKACGLTSVQIVMPGLDEEIADALLARSGGAAAKLAAIDNVVAEGLKLDVALLLARPALLTMSRSFGDFLSRIKKRPNVDIRGQLLSPIQGEGAGRYALLYPSYGEASWAMRRLRSIVRPSALSLFSQDAPPCVRRWIGDVRGRPAAVPGVFYRKPRKHCSNCGLSAECPGISASYLKAYGLGGLTEKEAVPPDIDLESLRRKLAKVRALVSRTSWAPPAKVEEIQPLLDGADQEMRRLVPCRSSYEGGIIRVALAGRSHELFLAPRSTYRGAFFMELPSFYVGVRGEAAMTSAEDRLLRAYLRLLARQDAAMKAAFD